MSGVDLRQLALLVALHDTQSLNEAARRLHMTPSAASQSLQRLRARLGDDIVARQGNAYVVTPFGEGALEAFRDMLRLWGEISAGSTVFDPPSSRAHWSVACAEEFTEIDLDASYTAIVAAAPGVRLDVGTPPGVQADWDALRSARLDVLLTTRAPPADASDLHAERFPDVLLTHACLSVAHPASQGVSRWSTCRGSRMCACSTPMPRICPPIRSTKHWWPQAWERDAARVCLPWRAGRRWLPPPIGWPWSQPTRDRC